MIGVGIVGVGFMGWIHYLAYQRASGVRLAAIATRSAKKRAGDWRDIRGNFGPPGQQVDLTDVATYEHWEQLLQDPQVQLVDICLPPHLHAPVATAALEAGKHVFCEKPIALRVSDAQGMIQAGRNNQRRLFVGHVLPFFPEFRFLWQAAQDGRYGALLGGVFKRTINDPQWLPDFYDPQRVGGPVVDLLIHDAHFVRLLWGMPQGVFSTGRMHDPQVAEFLCTQFLYKDVPGPVSVTGGVIGQRGRDFTHGFEVHFQRATVLMDFAVMGGEPVTAMPLTVLDDQGGVQRPELGEADPVQAFVAEVQEVISSLEQDRPSPLLDGELALDALRLCEAQNQSVKSGEIVWL